MKTEKPATSRNTYINSCSRIVIIAVLTVAMLVTVASAQAVAAPTWLDPESLSEADGSPVDQAQIGLDAAGNALVIWWAEESNGRVIKYAERAIGGEWSAPGYLTVGGELGEDARDLQLAVDAEGNAVALWRRYKGGDEWGIVETSRDAGGQWSSAREFSQEEHNASNPRVAASGGNMAATWLVPLSTDPADPDLQTYPTVLARVRAAGDVWDNDQVLSEVGDPTSGQQIAVNHVGNAIAAWSRFCICDFKTNIRASYYSPGSGWSQPPLDLLPWNVDSAYAPDVTIDQAGNAMVIWRQYDNSDASWHIRSAYRSADEDSGGRSDDWSVADDIFGGAQSVRNPKVDADGKGNAVAVWSADSADDGISSSIYAVARAAGRSWDEPTLVATLDEGGTDPDLRLAVNAAGDATVVWVGQDDSGSGYGIYSATRSAGSDPDGDRGGWSEPVVVDGGMSSDPGTAGIAIDGEGNSVAAWAEGTGAPVIQAAAYDVAGPRIDEVNIPATGTVGVPINFSASSFDVWSGIGGTTWSFGAGKQATGPSVSHTYTSPGSYQVQVEAADMVGNASTETRTIAISRSAQEPDTGPPATQPSDISNPSITIPQAKLRGVSLSRISLRTRCLKKKRAGSKSNRAAKRKKKRRLVRCGKRSKLPRRLIVRFKSSAAAKVKVRVTRRVKKRIRGKRHRFVTRTVMKRTLIAKKGKNSYVLPIKRSHARGRLTGKVYVPGAKNARAVRVRR